MSCLPWPVPVDDLEEPSLVPPLGTRRFLDAAPVAVMVSTVPDLNYIRTRLDGSRSFPLFNSILITPVGDRKGICVAGPYIGAPYGAMILESLIARGAEKILVIGWCGSIHPDIGTGDLFIPEAGIVQEGTSMNYQRFDQAPWTVRPSDAFTRDLVHWGRKQEMDIKTGTVWTTDAIYRETAGKVDFFRALGAGTVEMECSALFSVAAYRKVDIAALLVVSDSLAASGKNPGWQPGFRTSSFKQARKKACDMVMTFAGDLLKNDH